MKVLFLDVDGVMNCHEWDERVRCGTWHPDKVQLLNMVLEETGAKIVMSSAWRYLVYRGEMNLVGLEWLMRSHGVLEGRLIGITPNDSPATSIRYKGDRDSYPVESLRGVHIKMWLMHEEKNVVKRPEGPVESYAVVDDLDLSISACGHPFVQTDGEVGLSAYNAFRLIQLLNKEKS